MIRALVFDLDGTLVQTEKLKSISYAQAVQKLSPNPVTIEEVQDAFKQVVGRSREEVSTYLLDKYALQDAVMPYMQTEGIEQMWQALAHVRLEIYAELLANPEVLRRNQWEHNVTLLNMARTAGCSVGLATMSHREQAHMVLNILRLRDRFDVILTRDDVIKGKPDPEIYLLAFKQLDVDASDVIVIEDSPSGAQAALASGANVIVVTTPFTREQFEAASILDECYVVNDYERLLSVVQRVLGELNSADALG